MSFAEMKQYHLVRHQQTFEWNSLEVVPDGMFVLSSDAEALKKRIKELEQELGNLTMHHYNLGQKHDILVLKNRGLTNRIEELEKALAEIFRLADAVFVQRQFSGYTMGSIHALSAKALEAKK